MLITHTDLFTPYNLKSRIFKKVVRQGAQDRLALIAPVLRVANGSTAERVQSLVQAASDSSPVPQITVDAAGFLVSANAAARQAFHMVPADVGRPLQDLELSYRPIELRSGLDEARDSRRPVHMGHAAWRSGSPDERTYDVDIEPLLLAGELLGATVTFTDVSDFAKLDREHKAVERQLETAYEELQSTVEELETTNEELQSTNEELETTNEELQSTNEELETTNEELQSANDELEAMNEEQRERSGELDRLNLFLESILGQLGLAVVVVDNDQRIQLWNGSATEMWGLRASEVLGEHFLTLDIGLPVEELKPIIRQTVSADGDGELHQLVLEAVNRRGRKFECLVRALPLMDPQGTHYGAVLLMSNAVAAQD
jgi:two-component system CheB/CheR fusion protein